MNVSELIIHLQELEVIHGNLEVVYPDDELPHYPNGIDKVSVTYIHTPWYQGDVIQVA
jgi:hypothetical protein